MQDTRLGTEPLNKLIFRMVLPAIMAQLINALYNIVDRMFIGRIAGYGDLALTGVGITFPIIIIITAFAAFAGSGGAPLASRALGEQNNDRAQSILLNSVILLIIFAISCMLFFYIFKKPLLYLFGASDNTYPYANEYISVYLMGTLFVQFSVGLNPFISGQGNAKIAMLSVCIGAIINLILDPIFIFVLDFGVKGAGYATIISQACSAIWVVRFLMSKKSVIRIEIHKLKLDPIIIKAIFALGISPFILQSTNSLVNIVLNSSLEHYGGDLYVGAMAIMTSITTITFIPLDGLRQGMLPILAYNYGAGNRERLVSVIKKFLIISFTTGVIIIGFVLSYPRLFAILFTDNKGLADLTTYLIPIFFVGSILLGILLGVQGSLLAFGQAKKSIFIASLRKLILLIPLALILPHFYGVMGVIYAQPIADVLSVTAAAVIFFTSIRKILDEMPVPAADDADDDNEDTAVVA
ncbi:MAG: MATE family efflux transporter [Epulopiscium sp. Nele67-Bin002]|nr:MAG: MATE family efflux transporter [Epulopiscium sp. Nele67-Bin002]